MEVLKPSRYTPSARVPSILYELWHGAPYTCTQPSKVTLHKHCLVPPARQPLQAVPYPGTLCLALDANHIPAPKLGFKPSHLEP